LNPKNEKITIKYLPKVSDDAFDVQVGLGATMTGLDILEGKMLVSVNLAIVRPAEFIVVTFEQQMQKS